MLEYAEQKQTHCILLVAYGVSEKAEWVADIAQVSYKQAETPLSQTHTHMK